MDKCVMTLQGCTYHLGSMSQHRTVVVLKIGGSFELFGNNLQYYCCFTFLYALWFPQGYTCPRWQIY